KLYLNGCKAMAQARKQGKNCVRMWGSPANENTVAPISDLNNGNLLEENQLLISCMASLLSIQSFETAMEIVLGHIGRYYGAQHVAVVKCDTEKQTNKVVYAWTQTGEHLKKQTKEIIPFAQMPHWIDAFNQNRELVIHDITEWIHTYPEEYEFLRDSGVFSVCAIPFEVSSKLYGFLEVDNATLHSEDIILLKTLSYFITSEMTKQKLQQKQEYLIYHDTLTGLCNRNSYLNYLAGLNEDALSSMGVVRLDINGLKEYNTKFGFDYGDSLLCHMAQILKSVFAHHCVYRFTGDEFLVLCKGVTNEHFTSLVNLVRSEMRAEYLDCVAFGYTWSGVDIHMEDLIRHAEELLSVEKLMNKERQAYRSQAPQAVMLQNLVRALENDEFTLYLQPKRDIATGEIVGAEALVRYIHPKYGVIGPAKFVPQLEENGLIYYIDFFIFEQVCKMLLKWQQEGKPLRCISLNLSRKTMLREDLPKQMQAIYNRYKVPKKYIEIEITESFGDMERETFSRISGDIVAQGFRLSLDDFGSKYSNLSILSAVDLNVLKLDKSLVNDIVANPKTLTIVSNFLVLCRNLGIESVAEGVETEEQMSLLKQLGCNVVQGYLVNKPMPMTDFEEKYCACT
ncbi:MAG: GGDEF and EAL domain-containing protein, partial [Oscillospiraceae bacterium]|nr:GGDEF and EAL domain-containing protein [Oscillospiraceae bacterium]